MAQDRVIIVEGGQTLNDIALQEYGSRDAVFMILEDNLELEGIDCILEAGQLIKIKQDAIDIAIVNYLKELNIKPSTEVDDLEDFEIIGSGGDFDLSDFDDEDFY